MVIKNVFNNLDDAIAYTKNCRACGAAVDRVYYYPAEDRYYVSVIVNDFKFYELPEEERKKIACGAGGIEEYRLHNTGVVSAFDKNYMVNSLL